MADPQSYRPTDIPKLPGVYRFYDATDTVIYVGKAINLKNRLSNYFQGNLAEKTYRMVHQAVRVDWTIVDTEVEALQLEFSWIKQYAPQYNVQFRDDKSYPYLAITNKEEFPRVFITRKSKRPGISYFGPFTHTWALRSTFDVVLKTFPIRSCTTSNFERAKRTKRQCLLGDIGKCAAPCVEWISKEDHKALSDRLVKFMSNGNTDIVPTLRAEMELASSREEFERASKIRDSIDAIERAQESAEAALPENLTADIVAIHHDGAHAAGSIFIVRGGAIKGSRSWIVDQSKSLEGDDEMGALFYSIYSQSAPTDIPAEILINELPLDATALESWLSGLRGAPVALKVPQRGEKVEILATVKRNAQYSLIQFLSKRANDAAVSGKALLEIEEALDLSRTPLRIECFDISNISGTSVVASMVVFEDGVPKKSEYRRFEINLPENGTLDDTAAINQVLTRRLNRLKIENDLDESVTDEKLVKKFAYKPQLIIVDEPTAGLDPGERNRFHNLLADVGEDVVVILSTHIVDDVRELCNNMAIMNNGRLVYTGSPITVIDELRGQVWRKAIEREQLQSHMDNYRVISNKMVAGKPQIHVLSEINPGEGFVSIEPNLEDVFFNKIHFSETTNV